MLLAAQWSVTAAGLLAGTSLLCAAIGYRRGQHRPVAPVAVAAVGVLTVVAAVVAALTVAAHR